MDNILRNIMKNLNNISVFADMPALPGESHWGSRGLSWRRFDPNSYDIEMPGVLVNLLINKSNEFKETFSEYVNIIPRDFGGMIFAIYAHDTAVTEDMRNTAVERGLGETAEFINRTGVKLPMLDEDRNPNKQIGSDWWMSWYGYAYQNEYPEDVSTIGRAFPPQLRIVNTNKDADNQHGPLVVFPTSSGFGIYIQTNDGLKSIFWGQATNSLRKIFKGNIELNKSKVVTDGTAEGDIEPATRPKTKHLPVEESRFIQEEYKRKTQDRDMVWKIMIDENGTIFIQQGDVRHNLSKEQIISILKKEVQKENWFIKPGDKTNRPTSFGPFQVSDNLIESLSDPSNPHGISSLKNYRLLLEQNFGSDYHVPYEGWKVIIVGPKFSIAKNLGEGQALARPQYIVPETKVSPGEVTNEEFMAAQRGHKWTVLSTEFSEQRDTVLAAATRSQGTPSQKDFDNPQDAINYLSSLYLNMSSEEVDTNDDSILAGMSHDIANADMALRSAIEGSYTNNYQIPQLDQSYTNKDTEYTDNIDNTKISLSCNSKIRKVIAKISFSN